MSKPENAGGVDVVLKSLDEQHAKYKHMEMSLATKRRRLRQQIPDLARSLEMIEKLKTQKEEMQTEFLLSDQVFVKVIIMIFEHFNNFFHSMYFNCYVYKLSGKCTTN